MDVARDAVAAEEPGEPAELHRLPQREPTRHHADRGDQREHVKQPLHRVVDAALVVEAEGERRPQIARPGARPDRQQVAPEMPGQQPVREVKETGAGERPHRREMPQEAAAQPAAQRDGAREAEGEQRRGVVDLPAAADHRDHGRGGDPVREAHGGGMLASAPRARRFHGVFLRSAPRRLDVTVFDAAAPVVTRYGCGPPRVVGASGDDLPRRERDGRRGNDPRLALAFP